MTLNNSTRAGLTFGQILSLVGIIGSIFMVWLSLNVRLAQAEIRIEQLEKGRQENAQNIETIRKENREDHGKIVEKLDELIRSNRH